MTTETQRELLELAAKAIGGTLSHGYTKRRTGSHKQNARKAKRKGGAA